MQTYETVFITPADLSPQRVDEFIEKLKGLVTKAGGEFVTVDKWGRRRLAYPIKRHREGFYVFLQFKSPESVLAELTQLFRVSEDVIRQIVCKALKGKPATPMMSFPAPAAFHPAPGAPHAAGAGPAAAPVAAPKEVSHERPSAPSPAQ